MTDPYAAALDALFNAPGSAAAEHVDRNDAVALIRVIIGRPDQMASLGGGQIVTATIVIEIRRSDVANPAPGDRIIVGALDESASFVPVHAYDLTDEPMLDVEGLTWTCGAEPSEEL